MDKKLVLNEIRNYYGLEKNTDFAKFFGLSDQNAYSWTKRGYIDYELVYEKCPEINPEWLLSCGEKGPMLKSAITQEIKGDNNTQVAGDSIGPSDETLSKTLDALSAEQDRCTKLQHQIDTLLDIVRNMSK